MGDIFGKVGSVEVGQAKPGEGRARRLAITADALLTQPWAGIDTTVDIVAYAAKTFGKKDAIGWRDVVDTIEEEKEVTKTVGGKQVKEMKKWKYFKLGPYKYHTFIETQDIISEVSRGLVELGVGKDDVFNIYASTSVNWQLMCRGCERISTAVATAYDSLGEEGLAHSLNEPECVGIFTHGELLPTVAKVAAKVPSLRLVIYDGDAKSSVLDDIRGSKEGMKVLSIDELRKLGQGRDLESIKDRLPTPDTTALIMYTSGSTGAPKGVVISHRNLTATVAAIYKILGHHLSSSDTFLAYLPLAHILEYVVEMALFFVGMTTGYGKVKTLTDQSVRGCKGDIAELAPSIMIGVPAVWELIRKGITSKVNAGGTIKKGVFNAAISIKQNNIPGLKQVVDAAVLAQVRAATGGRLRLTLSGGAALSRETQEFLSLALVTVLQGYGLTESCGMCTILPPEKMQYGSVGLPVPAQEVKLIDVPDAGYFANGETQQGEICIRGNAVVKGYYKRPDLNEDRSIFTEDGWFRTGDVGQWNADGTLSVIDRIKNLVKLQGGEYIALERLEATYKSCHLVSNICVHADTNAKQPIAIIIPHEGNLRTQLNDKNTPLADLCAKDDVRALVMRECNGQGKKQSFKPMEMLEAVVLTPDEWTPESGLVTAAQKVQRKKIAQAFESEIKEIYKHQ